MQEENLSAMAESVQEEENKQESESIAIPETPIHQEDNNGDFELPVEANYTQDQTPLA